ncbi:MAG: FliH/SctL family protein [Sodalis sp. (in: enterobacteria)]|uniref:FliH/SctL family protein n=1 Tax=Sodalis sp. (in: enterobacteria) TaxID=1898979 RepID=UPI0039E2E6DA
MSEHAEQTRWQNWLPADLSLVFADSLPAPLLSTDHDEKAWQAEQRGFKQGQQEGEQQGYRQGFDKGRSDGFEQGLQDAQAEQEHITAQMADFLRELKATLAGVDAVMPARLMQIALTAAGKILGQSPVCDSRVVLSTIQQLLHDRPLFDGCLRLYVHPDDLPSLQRHLDRTLETRRQQLCQMLKEGLPHVGTHLK